MDIFEIVPPSHGIARKSASGHQLRCLACRPVSAHPPRPPRLRRPDRVDATKTYAADSFVERCLVMLSCYGDLCGCSDFLGLGSSFLLFTAAPFRNEHAARSAHPVTLQPESSQRPDIKCKFTLAAQCEMLHCLRKCPVLRLGLSYSRGRDQQGCTCW